MLRRRCIINSCTRREPLLASGHAEIINALLPINKIMRARACMPDCRSRTPHQRRPSASESWAQPRRPFRRSQVDGQHHLMTTQRVNAVTIALKNLLTVKAF